MPTRTCPHRLGLPIVLQNDELVVADGIGCLCSADAMVLQARQLHGRSVHDVGTGVHDHSLLFAVVRVLHHKHTLSISLVEGLEEPAWTQSSGPVLSPCQGAVRHTRTLMSCEYELRQDVFFD